MRQPFWALVNKSKPMMLAIEEDVSVGDFGPVEWYLIGQLDGVGRGTGGHWLGKVVDGGPFFWKSYTIACPWPPYKRVSGLPKCDIK